MKRERVCGEPGGNFKTPRNVEYLGDTRNAIVKNYKGTRFFLWKNRSQIFKLSLMIN